MASGIAVASTSLPGVGCVTSVLDLVPSSIPRVTDRIQDVRMEAMIATIMGVKSDHMGVRPRKKSAY